jgi:hypothetical protein
VNDDDRDFRERFDTAVVFIVLALVGLVVGVVARAMIRGLYF